MRAPLLATALLLVAPTAAAAPKVTFAAPQALLDACPGRQTFTGVARGVTDTGAQFDLTGASFDVQRPSPGIVDLVVSGSGTLGGEPVKELTLRDRIGDGVDDGESSLSAVYAAIASPHAIVEWLGGRSVKSGSKQVFPRNVLRALNAQSGHVYVDHVKGGSARLRFDVRVGGRVQRVKGELVVDPATWLVKSFLVDVDGAVRGHARGFGICR